MNFLRNISVISLLLIANLVYGQLPKSGLYFYSHDYNIDQRTTLILNDNEYYVLNPQEEFKLEFDVYIREQKIKFGYIFRILSNKEENFDFIINNQNKGYLVVNNQDYSLDNDFLGDQWNHVSITFLKREKKIRFSFNEEEVDCLYDLSQTKSLLINFGLCDIKGFLTHDVAPIILKDIKVSSQNKGIHFWPLGKHTEDNITYDDLKEKQAIALNPYWLMDNSIYWQKKIEFTSSVFPQVAFDSIQNQILIQNGDKLITYSLLKDTLLQTTAPNKALTGQLYNRMFFDPLTENLFYYGLDNKNIAYHNPETNFWNTYEDEQEEATHAHHNRYISQADSMLYIFGGYGYYKFNSDFFKVNLKTNEWIAVDLSHTITPRYLAAMGGNRSGDKLYVFGGRGAEMGRQELSPKNFSDLYEIDLKTDKIKLLYKSDEDESSENVYSNSLVVDENSENFYVLAYSNSKYSTKAILKQFNFEAGTLESLADPIDFNFRDVSSFCDLYYSPSLNKLIALLASSEDQNTSTIRVYTLDFPPMLQENVIQKAKSPEFPLLLYIILAVVVILILFFALKKITGNSKESEVLLDEAQESDDLFDIAQGKGQKYYEIQKESVLFLGGFQVFDKEGKNITGEFTPTLKYMLVLIILYSLKNNKGISSAKLQEFLWFDKTEEAARNNRSVNLRKLRVLLQEVGNIDITNQNGYWFISAPDNVFFDYEEMLRLIGNLKTSPENEENILRLLEILSFGSMLPNIQFEWVDDFKTDFSNEVLDTLSTILNSKNLSDRNPGLQLKIVDSILKIDPINEEAVAIKCKILYKIGKKGLAKATFDSFSKEYRSLLGEPYCGSIKNFLE